MKRILAAFTIALLLVVSVGFPALAATTATVSVNATPKFISISVSPIGYDFGAVAESTSTNTTTNYFTVTNTSSVTTNVTIGMLTSNWTGGVQWLHSDTNTPGADTCGMLANKAGTWGTSDVTVKYSGPDKLATNQTATTDFNFGLSLTAPTSFGDGILKQNTVKLIASG